MARKQLAKAPESFDSNDTERDSDLAELKSEEWRELEAWKYLNELANLVRLNVGSNNSWLTVWMRLCGKLIAPTAPASFEGLQDEVRAHLQRLKEQGEPVAPPPELSRPEPPAGPSELPVACNTSTNPHNQDEDKSIDVQQPYEF